MSSEESALFKNIITNFKEIGVSTESIGFANVTMHSEHFICVRENKQSAKSSLKIVDLRKGIEISEKPMSADSTIMNPNKPHLALRAINTVQVFDIDSKAKIASLQIGFEVLFWTWLNDSTILMVSDNAIHRWEYETADSVPLKWFDKSSALNDCQIINAEIDKSSNWCFISGISLKNGKIEGTIQLYNEEKKVSQIIEGHAGNFFSLKAIIDNQVVEYDIFSFSSRSKVTEMKLHLIQINGCTGSTHNFSKKIIDLPFIGAPENDFPIRVIFYATLNLVFVYTKFGFVYVVEPQTGTCVMYENYSESPIYLVAPSLNSDEHFVLNRKGDVLQAGVNIESFFGSCIEKGVDYYDAVGSFMSNLPIDLQVEAYRNQFDKMKNSGFHSEALLFVAKSGKPFLRTFEYISSIKDFPAINETSALLEYFAIVLEDDKLNEVESLELVQLALGKKKLDIVRKWLDSDQIFCTTQLGKVIIDTDPELALRIFKKANSEPMVLHCLAILGKFDEFSESISASTADLNLKPTISSLLKTKAELIPSLVSAVIESKPYLVDEDVVLELFKPEYESILMAFCAILSKHPEILAIIKSREINTKLAIKLVDSDDSSKFTEFITKCGEHNLELSKQEILPLLKSAKMHTLAFSFESDLEECIELSNHLIGHEKEIKSSNLVTSDVKRLIFNLIEKDSKKYAKLCSKMAEFIDEKDFEEIKLLLKSSVDAESFCDFLTHWAKFSGSKDSSDDILQSVIAVGNEDRLLDFCEKIEISNPESAFNQISNFNYKSKSLKILAYKYSLHSNLLLLFESKNDKNEADEFIKMLGANSFWSNILVLLESGVSENFIKSLLILPTDSQIVSKIGSELAENGKLSIISDFILNNDTLVKDDQIISLRLKILCDKSNAELFLSSMNDPKASASKKEVMQYCERINPKLALRYYLNAGEESEVLRLCYELHEWDSLSNFLINSKSTGGWSLALSHENSVSLIEKVIENAHAFPDTESASCLIKVLAGREDQESLLNIMSAWLENNQKLRSSRSLQTLYLINLLKSNPGKAEKPALELDNYNIEEVLHVAISSNELELSLKILDKFEQWNYAFKVALYGLKNAQMAEIYAQKSGHPEAWHALAEFCLVSGDAVESSKFAKQAGNFRRQKELVIMLHINENYEDLLDYLLYLKTTHTFEPVYEREIFLCLMKLGKSEELEKFTERASTSFANELGKILYREGSIELASKCFKQAGNFEKAATCFLKLGNIESAAECAMKTNSYDLWLEIIKISLMKNKDEIARKFGLKCAQQHDKFEKLLAVYESCGAYESLVGLIDIVLDSSALPQEFILLIGDLYCREFPEKLEPFVNKFYSTIPSAFIQILAKYRRWKECFKLLLLRSNLDEALDLVINHPSIDFDHRKLTAVISKIKNQQILESLLQFYHDCDPRMLMELQEEFVERLEMGTLIKFFKDRKSLFVLDKTMRRFQAQNPGNVVVSTGLNEHLIQINDYYGLIESIKKCPSIDAVRISETLKSSERRHFRILAAKLMANSGEFVKALTILVEEDALIETLMILSQSSNVQYAEAILARYARIRNAVMFVAVSYVLFDLLRPDIIFELSQRSDFQDLNLPIFCQIMRNKLK